MAYTNLLIPNWLWEGDAVETETRVTGFGRSVIPQFQMPLRAYLDTFGAPSYAKLMGRSFREYVPNHYVFGQKFSHLLQQRYGQDVIGRIWQQTLNTPIPFSFSRSVKKITGKSVDNFAKEILSTTSVIKKIKLKQKGFTNYFYPYPVNDSTFVAIKNGFDGIHFMRYLGPFDNKIQIESIEGFVEFEPGYCMQKYYNEIMLKDEEQIFDKNNYDETLYLKKNNDINDLVQKGIIKNGYVHYSNISEEEKDIRLSKYFLGFSTFS
jgi:hypothetical protein